MLTQTLKENYEYIRTSLLEAQQRDTARIIFFTLREGYVYGDSFNCVELWRVDSTSVCTLFFLQDNKIVYCQNIVNVSELKAEELIQKYVNRFYRDDEVAV